MSLIVSVSLLRRAFFGERTLDGPVVRFPASFVVNTTTVLSDPDCTVLLDW